MAKRRFFSCSRNDEITTCGYSALTFAKCTTIMIVELAVTSGVGSSLDYREWFWYGYGIVMTWYWIKVIVGIAL
jgi:hypothetical protein